MRIQLYPRTHGWAFLTKPLNMVFGGFDLGTLSAKGGLEFEYRISSRLGLTLTAYYLYHHQVLPDHDIEGLGKQDFVYGQTSFEKGDQGYFDHHGDALVVPEDNCIGYSSIGINLGTVGLDIGYLDGFAVVYLDCRVPHRCLFGNPSILILG